MCVIVFPQINKLTNCRTTLKEFHGTGHLGQYNVVRVLWHVLESKSIVVAKGTNYHLFVHLEKQLTKKTCIIFLCARTLLFFCCSARSLLHVPDLLCARFVPVTRFLVATGPFTSPSLKFAECDGLFILEMSSVLKRHLLIPRINL